MEATIVPAPHSLRVFLCHASEDKETVRRLYRLLQQVGTAPWLDEEDILPGQEWADAIWGAVRDADAVLVCVSRSVNKIGFLQKEIRIVLDVAELHPPGAIFVMAVRLGSCHVPEQLTQWQWVDLFAHNGLRRLIRSLQARASALGREIPVDHIQPSTFKVGSRDLTTETDREVERAIGELGPFSVNVDELRAHLAQKGVDSSTLHRSLSFLEADRSFGSPPNACLPAAGPGMRRRRAAAALTGWCEALTPARYGGGGGITSQGQPYASFHTCVIDRKAYIRGLVPAPRGRGVRRLLRVAD